MQLENCTVKQLHVQTSKLYAETKAHTTQTFTQHPLKQNKISLVHPQSLAALGAPPESPALNVHVYMCQTHRWLTLSLQLPHTRRAIRRLGHKLESSGDIYNEFPRNPALRGFRYM